MRIAYSRTPYVEGQPYTLEVKGIATSFKGGFLLTPDGNTGYDSVLPDGTWTQNTQATAQYQIFYLSGNLMAICPADPAAGKTFQFPCVVIG